MVALLFIPWDVKWHILLQVAGLVLIIYGIYRGFSTPGTASLTSQLALLIFASGVIFAGGRL